VDILFASPDLRRIDALQCEACWFPFFSDERPLRGVLGLVDWRMGARLSRQILRGRLRGKRGEVLLMPCERFLPFEKLFLCGLGPRSEFSDAGYVEAVDTMLSTFEAARIRAAVCALPGRTTGAIEPERAITSLLACARNYSDHDELTILDEPSAQRVMEPVIAHERRRERAEPG
jgi:hypothetical protein